MARPKGPPFTVPRYGSLGASIIGERNWLKKENKQLRGTLSLAEEGLANYAQEVERLLVAQVAFVNANKSLADKTMEDTEEIKRLRVALKKIATYDPGKFRPLEDEIAIYRLATDALGDYSREPQSAEPPE